MSQREETGDRVHSSETPLHGEQDSQTEAQSLEQQRPDCPGLSMAVEKDGSDNGSSESSVSKSHVPRCDINNRPKRRSSCKRISTESKDPSTSRTPCKPLNSRNLNLDFNVSPLRMSTQCPESSDSDASFKSDMSKDNIINLKRRSSLRTRLKCTASTGSSSNLSQGRINAKERHSSLQKSNGSSESSVSKSHVPRCDINNRPKRRSSCKRISTESKDPSTSRTPCKPLNSRNLNLDFNVSPLRMSTQCPESSDSDASFKSDMSKDNIINLKRRSSLRTRLKCTASTGSSSNLSQGRINAKERHSSLQKSPMTSGGKRSSWTLRKRPRKFVV